MPENSISGLVGSRASSTYKTVHTDACKTHYTKPVYTTVFLRMDPVFQTCRRHRKLKYLFKKGAIFGLHYVSAVFLSPLIHKV